MNKYIETDIKEIKEQLVWNRQHGHKTILLLGSGMSVTAGIPASEGIISRIRADFSSLCARTHPVTYEDHLSILTQLQRQALIKEMVSDAKLNAAHLYMAALVKEGYVDKLLTTNFDTLIHRSLALENIYPNIFDFTTSQSAESADFSNISLFHMHGQKDGLLSLRDEDSFDQYLGKMERYFKGAFEKQTVIVVGFSGTDDPVFSHLASLRSFENRLYWVGHEDNEPEEHVFRGVLQKTSKQACYIKGYDADSFFTELNRLLDIPEPRILANPMSLVEEVMGNIAVNTDLDFKPKKIEEPEVTDWLAKTVTSIEEKKENRKILSETVKQKIDNDDLVAFAKESWVNSIYLNYEKLKELVELSQNEEAKKYFSFFLFNWGTDLEKQADAKEGLAAEELYQEAFKRFAEAISIKPDLREAYNQWGVCLRNLAKSKEGDESEKLYAEAFRKFEEAILINPEHHESYNNWAIGLAHLAETKNEVEAEKLYFQAFEKYKEALQTKSDLYEVYNNWGVCLKNLASMKRETEAEELYLEAFQKFDQAIKLKPDFDMAYTNWGVCLRDLAKTKKPEEASQLYREAFEKYKTAIQINPQSADAMNNWGVDLGHLAQIKGLEEARQLLTQAFDKYAGAVKVNSEHFSALNNWAIDNWNYGNLKSGAEADKLYKEAFDKFNKALEILPDSAEIHTNKAICLSKVGQLENYSQGEKLFEEAGMHFQRALDIKPKLFEAHYNWGIAFRNRAEKQGVVKADELYILALKHFEKAMKTKPERYKLNKEWDAAITNLSVYLYEDEPEKMYHQTFKRYQDSIFTERSSLDLYNTYDINLTKTPAYTPEEEYEKLLAEAFNEPVKV